MWQPWKCNVLFKKYILAYGIKPHRWSKWHQWWLKKKKRTVHHQLLSHLRVMKLFGVSAFSFRRCLQRRPLFAHRQRRLWICWSSEERTPLFEHKDVHSSPNKQLQNQKNKPDGMSPVPSSNSSLSVKVLPLYTVNISTESCAVCQAQPYRFKMSFFPIMHFTGPVEN